MTKLANEQKIIIGKETGIGMITPINIIPYTDENVITNVKNQRQEEVTGSVETQDIVKGKKTISGKITLNASVSKLGHILTGTFGDSINTDNGDGTHTHLFNIENKDVKTYSIDVDDYSNTRRYSGVKFDNIELSLNDNMFKLSTDIYGTKSIEQEKIVSVDSDTNKITFNENVLLKTSDKIGVYNKKGVKTKSNLDIISINGKEVELNSVSGISPDHSVALEKQESGISNNEINKSLLSCRTDLFINNGVNEIKVEKVIDLNETISRNIDEGEDFYLGSCYREEVTSKNLTINGSMKISIASEQANRLLANYKNGDLTFTKRIISDSVGNKYTIETSMLIENVSISKQVNNSVELDITYSNVKTTKIELIDTIESY